MGKEKKIEILLDYFQNLIPICKEEQQLVKQIFQNRL